VHSGHEITTNGQLTGNMTPEHGVGLKIDSNAYNHGNSRGSDGRCVRRTVLQGGMARLL